MKKTVQRVFKYQGKRILVQGENDKSQGETKIIYPAFVEIEDGKFIPLSELEAHGEEIHTKSSRK